MNKTLRVFPILIMSLRQASHAYDKNKTNVLHWRIDTTRTHILFGKLSIAP